MFRRPFALSSTALRPPALAAILLLAGVAAPARADLILTVESVTVSAGSSDDALDVTLTNTGPSAVSIGGFSFELTTSFEITFTLANISTSTSPYIFVGHSLFGPVISTTGPGQTLDASDVYDVAGSGTTVASGATVGLGQVLFNVGGATGQFAVTLAGYPLTGLSSPQGVNVPFTSEVNGTITVASVPEPSSVALMGVGLTILAGLARPRRAKVAA
jgi:hypothetical protein